MKGPLAPSEGAHFLLYEEGQVRKVDNCLEQVLEALGPGDLFLTGANALDAFGHAALLIGSSGGGGYGVCMPFLYTEGVHTMVLSSVTKLIPGNLTQLLPQISRRRCNFSYGMACSLLPVPGQIVTECQALEAVAQVDARVFSSGGSVDGRASIAIQVDGARDQVERVLALVEQVKSLPQELPAEPGSSAECSFPCFGCGHHIACAYANKQAIFHQISQRHNGKREV